MIRQFIRRILCRTDFWYYIRTGRPLTKIKYYKKDVPNKYWGRCLIKDGEVVPHHIVYLMNPEKIEVTEKDRRMAEKIIRENDLLREGK